MGNYTSKLLYHGNHDKSKESNVSSLILENRDTCTPQPQKKNLVNDPRSVTTGIIRTPIEIIATKEAATEMAISAVPKYLQQKPFLETNFDFTPTTLILEKCLDPRSPNVDMPRTPILLNNLPQSDTPKVTISKRRSNPALLSEMRQKMLGLDPRSPAVDFDRTPILKPKSLISTESRSQENLYTSIYDIKMPSRLSYCETTDSFDIPEINALPDVVANLDNSENSPKTLFDSSSSSSTETVSNCSAVTVLNNGKGNTSDTSFSSSFSDSYNSPKMEARSENLEVKLVADTVNIIDNVLLTAMKDVEHKFKEAESKIKIWRDTLSPDIQEDLEYDDGSESEDLSEFATAKEEIIIEFDDDDNLAGTMKKAEIAVKRSDTGEEKRIFKNNLETKKLFSPSRKQATEVMNIELIKNRTPLRNRSNSNSKLRGAIMKSPLLQRKTPFAMKMHQENTPPRSKRTALKSRMNNTQWDGDSTVII